MQTNYFSINKNEYCHITPEVIFIFNSKDPDRIPLEHELGEGWGIMSVYNYIFFGLIFSYSAVAISYYGKYFFMNPINYGALLLLFLSFRRIQTGFNSSNTPTIQRNRITRCYLRTPRFSFPRVVIYFQGPENKILKRIIPVRYKNEAKELLIKENLIQE